MKRPGILRTVRQRPRTKAGRRLRSAVTLLAILGGFGVLFASAQPTQSQADAGQLDAAAIAAGAALYNNSCISCHGVNLQGVTDRGPSLIGVGQAAVYFQVATGRMPLADNGAQAARKQPTFTPEQTAQLGAYIQANGGGPQVPVESDGTSASTDQPRADRSGWRAVSTELRLLPQLHRSGRCPLAGQVRTLAE